MNCHQKQKTHMKTQIFILSFITMVATSVLGAPGAGATAPSQGAPASPPAAAQPGVNNPNSPSTQPGSPAVGPQTMATNNISGQNMVTNNVSGQNANQPPQ